MKISLFKEFYKNKNNLTNNFIFMDKKIHYKENIQKYTFFF